MNPDENSLPNIQPYTVENMDTYDESFHEPTVLSYEEEESSPRKFPVVFIIGGLVVVGILALLFLLLSTRKSPPASAPNTNTGTNQPVTLQWWGVFLDEDVVQPLLDDYKSENPNVTIEYANKMPSGPFESSVESYQAELNRVLEDDNFVELPDIFMVENTWVGDYESKAQPSTSFSTDEINSIFYPAIAKDFANGGVVYGVPLWMDTLAILYNKDLLSSSNIPEPPTEWSAFRDAAITLTKRQGSTITQAGFASGLSTNVTFYFELMNLLLTQNGVAITDSTNQPVFASDVDSVDAIQFFANFGIGNSATWSAAQKNDAAAFLEGDVAMIASTSWRYRDILRFNESLGINLDIGVSKIPQVQGQSRDLINWSNYWGNMVSVRRPYAVESWKFLKWMSEPEQLEKLHANIKNKYGYFGQLYPRRDMATQLQDDQYLKTFNESLEFAESWYMVKGREVKRAFAETLTSGINQGSLTGLQNEIIELLALKGFLTIE